MNFGARAHDFGKLTLEELSPLIAAKGASCIQLALTKVNAGISEEPGQLSPSYASHVAEIFRRHGIRIAVLGCYINLIHPDLTERKKLLERFKELLRLARDFGCSIVGSETGSVNTDYSFNPESHGEKPLQTLIGNVAELVETAEKFGVCVGIEGVAKHVANTPERLHKVLEAVDSPNLQVIFDPVNFLTAENHQNHKAIISEAFDRFGPKIQIIHAKDYVVENGQIKTVPAGKGLLNYEFFVKLLQEHKPNIDIMLEDTKPEFFEGSMAFLRELEEKEV
jgi:L-ribulose-5-phosphate 3-epimerase